MRVSLIAVFVVGSLGSVTIARADPCEVLDANAAAWAQKLVARGAMVSHFCETCGDKTPSVATKVASITVVKDHGDDHGNRHIAINGKPVDLAYTYVQTGPTTWANVGMLVGCSAQGVTTLVSTARPKVDGNAPMVELGPEYSACAEYVHVINQLARCDKFPKEALAALRTATEQMKQSWSSINTMPPEQRKPIFDACRQAKSAIVQAAASMSCPVQ